MTLMLIKHEPHARRSDLNSKKKKMSMTQIPEFKLWTQQTNKVVK
jgi:hypothetical protein